MAESKHNQCAGKKKSREGEKSSVTVRWTDRLLSVLERCLRTNIRHFAVAFFMAGQTAGNANEYLGWRRGNGDGENWKEKQKQEQTRSACHMNCAEEEWKKKRQMEFVH